jgi:hypothetical protein
LISVYAIRSIVTVVVGTVNTVKTPDIGTIVGVHGFSGETTKEFRRMNDNASRTLSVIKREAELFTDTSIYQYNSINTSAISKPIPIPLVKQKYIYGYGFYYE